MTDQFTQQESSSHTPSKQPLPQLQTFEVTTSGAGNLVLTPPNTTTPSFYLKNSTFSLHKLTPSLTLHNSSSSGKVLAVLKLGKIKPHVVGIGDPSDVGGEERVVWENLKKGGRWRSPWWEFEFDSGVDGEGGRKRYRWESEGELSFTRGRPGLVLREVGKEEVLGRFEWMRGGKVSPWGIFEVLGNRDGDGEGDGYGLEEGGLERLRLMALITGLCVVVSGGSGI